MSGVATASGEGSALEIQHVLHEHGYEEQERGHGGNRTNEQHDVRRGNDGPQEKAERCSDDCGADEPCKERCASGDDRDCPDTSESDPVAHDGDRLHGSPDVGT